jgi:hypothetical protein
VRGMGRRREGESAQSDRLRQQTAEAVDEALRLVDDVVAAPDQASSDRAIDVAFADAGDAAFALKRVNEALAVGEWLDEVEAWVWRVERSTRPPLSEHGRATGIELRLQQRRR